MFLFAQISVTERSAESSLLPQDKHVAVEVCAIQALPGTKIDRDSEHFMLLRLQNEPANEIIQTTDFLLRRTMRIRS